MTMMIGCNVYEHIKPKYVTNEKWVCQEVDMYFVGWDEEKRLSYGQYIKDGKVKEFCVSFDYARGILFRICPKGKNGIKISDVFLKGQCRFKEDMFIVTIDEEYKSFLGNDVEELTFVKELIE